MNFKVETVESPSGARAEVATLNHNGQSFTALGSCVDLEQGVICAYVSGVPGDWTLKTFAGELISKLQKSGESFGFCDYAGRPSKIVHFRMEFAGYMWSGKLGLNWNQLIRLRRGRKVS